MDREREDIPLGGAPAARGCSIEGEKRLLLGVGLLDGDREEADFWDLGELPMLGAAR